MINQQKKTKRLKTSELRTLPVAGPKDDGDHAGPVRFVKLKSELHFHFTAVFRGEKISTYEQENELSIPEVLVYFTSPILSRGDFAEMPRAE